MYEEGKTLSSEIFIDSWLFSFQTTRSCFSWGRSTPGTTFCGCARV